MGQKNPYGPWITAKDTRGHSRTIRWDEITLGDITDWASYEPYMHARENVIEFNEVHDCLKLLHDGNCIYLSGNGKGNIMRSNVTYNHPEGAMIRTDDDSHGALVQGNLLFGTMGNLGITIKGLNTETGNIIVNCQVLTGLAGNTVDPECNLSRNVFYHIGTDLKIAFHYGMKGVKEGLYYNLYYHEGGKGDAMLKFQMQESQTKVIDKHSLAVDDSAAMMFTGIIEWQGAKVKNLETIEESSSLGLSLGTDRVWVLEVPAGSFAAKVGLRQGDLIVSLNRQPVKNVADLQRLTKSVEPASFQLEIIGNRGRQTLKLQSLR